MSNVLQILSSNYSGESVNITFTPLIGDVQNFDNVSLPYNFINENFDGNYSLFFPDYNLTYKFQIPSVPQVNKCRCTEFSFTSFLGGVSKNSYRDCAGNLRKLTLQNNQTHRDCVRINEYTAGTNTNVSVFGYCNSISDCQTLTQPPTPTQTRTPTPTPSITPSYTPQPTVSTTPTKSITPSVTPTVSIGATGDCMCTTIVNLSNSETNVSLNFCKYPDYWDDPNIILSLVPNQETRICAIYNTVSGNNISVSYEYGLCLPDGGIRTCPPLTPTPTPTQSPLPQTSILLSGSYMNTSNNSQTNGVFKYNFYTNTITYLNIPGIAKTGLSHFFDENTNTGFIWTKRQTEPIIKEYYITNSSYDNIINRDIVFTRTSYVNRLTYIKNTTLITTRKSGNTQWVIEVSINPNLENPIDTFKFEIPFQKTDVSGDLMYTNTGKFIWISNSPSGYTVEQYVYETGYKEFEGNVCCIPEALWQHDGNIYSSQGGAGMRIRYDLTTANTNWFCPMIQCGGNTGDGQFGCPGCESIFQSVGGSSLLINNNTEFIPNQ